MRIPEVRSPFTEGLRKSGTTFSVAISFFWTFCSRILGYLRDIAIFLTFGATGLTDIFLVAFRLPNFFRRLFAEGAFTQAFVPVLTTMLHKSPAGEVRNFISRTFGSLAVVLFVVTAIGMLLAPVLIFLFAPGLSEHAGQLELASEMLRITFPYLIFISLAAMATGVLNCFGAFGVPAFTPVLLNLSLIGAALWLAPRMEEPITALAWGVLAGGAAQLLVQLPFLAGRRMLSWPRIGFSNPQVRKVLQLMSPAILGSSVVQINLLIDTFIASWLISGSISWLYLSDRFVEFPVGLFGVTLSMILLPRMALSFAERSPARYNALLNWGGAVVLLTALPSLAGLVLLSAPILSTLVQYGEFTAHDVRMTELSLMAYAVGIPAFISVKVLNAAFFARHEMRLPVKIAVGCVLANLVFNVSFVLLWQYFNVAGVHAGLALATSLSSWLNTALLFGALSRRDLLHIDPLIKKLSLRVVIASLTMIALLVVFLPDASAWGPWSAGQRMLVLAELVLGGASAYVVVLYVSGFRWRDVKVLEKGRP